MRQSVRRGDTLCRVLFANSPHKPERPLPLPICMLQGSIQQRRHSRPSYTSTVQFACDVEPVLVVFNPLLQAIHVALPVISFTYPKSQGTASCPTVWTSYPGPASQLVAAVAPNMVVL